MTKEKLEYFRSLLLEKRKKVVDQIEKLKDMQNNTDPEEGVRYSDDLAEFGAGAMDREQFFMFLSREEKYLSHLNRSLEDIESGEYGICRICGEEIDEERLEAVPTTRSCVRCKTAESKR